MNNKTKNYIAIALGLLGLFTSFFVIPVIFSIASLVLALQILKSTKNLHGKFALAISLLGILVVIGVFIFVSQLSFTSEEFGW